MEHTVAVREYRLLYILIVVSLCKYDVDQEPPNIILKSPHPINRHSMTRYLLIFCAVFGEESQWELLGVANFTNGKMKMRTDIRYYEQLPLTITRQQED